MSIRSFNGLGALSGHAASMITSFKNNSRTKEIEHFKTTEDKHTTNQLYFKKKATEKQLEEIRVKFNKERRKERIVKSIFFAILIAVIAYLIW